MKNLLTSTTSVSMLGIFLYTMSPLHVYAGNDNNIAWQQVEQVLIHPRCLNCHSAGDSPKQADDRHDHQFRVLNGHQGKGNPGALCIACHQDSNQAASGVPGAANWQHAPASMTWESSPGKAMKGKDLCQTLRAPQKNGGRDLNALLEHLRTEPLVLWAWSPGSNAKGEPRTTPVISHEEFIQFATLWAKDGGKCPTQAPHKIATSVR